MPVLADEDIQAAETARPEQESLFDQLNKNLNLAMSLPQNSPLSKDELDFLREKCAFIGLLPSLVATHLGQYVAVHDGKVVDADPSQRALVGRFFERFGDEASVYIGFVGPPPAVRVPTPFFRPSG